MFDLLEAGEIPPKAEAIAAHAGVSVSSVFRYFDSIEDLRQVTINRYFEHYASLFEIPEIGQGTLDDRISRLVEARIALYATIAPIARFARMKASTESTVFESLELARWRFADQIRDHFSAEFAALTSARANDLASVIDTLTSFESWDLGHTAHHRVDRLIQRSWVTALKSLLA